MKFRKLILIHITQTLDVIIRKRLMWIQCKSTERPDIKQNNNYTHKDFYKKGVLICVVQKGHWYIREIEVKLICELLIVVVGSKVKWKVRGNDLISRLCKNMDGKIGTFIWPSPPSRSHLTSVRCWCIQNLQVIWTSGKFSSIFVLSVVGRLVQHSMHVDRFFGSIIYKNRIC